MTYKPLCRIFYWLVAGFVVKAHEIFTIFFSKIFKVLMAYLTFWIFGKIPKPFFMSLLAVFSITSIYLFLMFLLVC